MDTFIASSGAKHKSGSDFRWLEGLTILDFSSLLPCPFAAHLLAKMGARVLKIESPNRPDPARQYGHVAPGQVSSYYRALNENKELVWLDLKDPKNREKLHELVRGADGAIEGYRPDVRKRLGIDYETLSALNPRLVYVSVSGFDPHGPLRARAGHDNGFMARAGIIDQTRDRDGRCVLPGIPIGDHSVAYAAAFRMACALIQASKAGRGEHVEISIEETLLEIQTPFLREAMETGILPVGGQTLVTGRYPCYQLYALKEGTFALGALELKFWETFCDTLGRPDLRSAAFQYATGAEARRVEAEIHEAFSTRTFAQWRAIFENVDCCLEPVLAVKDVIDGLQS